MDSGHKWEIQIKVEYLALALRTSRPFDSSLVPMVDVKISGQIYV
jgi:hypothetical protein